MDMTIKYFIKTIFTFILLALVLAGCSKVNDGDPYTISGTLLNNCENQEPVANEELYFLVDWEAPEEERFATTDANGNFEYTFEGPPNNESVIGGSIRLTNEKVVLCGIPNSSFDKDMEAGTIYVNPPKDIQITFEIQGEGFDSQDSLFIDKGWPVQFPSIAIAGPFENPIIIKEEWLRYATTGTGTMLNYVEMEKPNVRRLNGQFGSLCYWEVRRSGQVIAQGREEISFESCTESATMKIDLGEPSK